MKPDSNTTVITQRCTRQRRFICVVTVLLTSAFFVGISATPTMADNGGRGPHPHDRGVTTPFFNSGTPHKEGTRCNWFGCHGGDFWRIYGQFTATYHFGDVQGTFKFRRFVPQPDHNRGSLEGRVIWSVYEKRATSSRYIHVKSFYPPIQKGRGDVWRTYDTRLALDGQVKIVATANAHGTGYGRSIGLSSIQLKYVDLHPYHVDKAKILCMDRETADIELEAWIWNLLDRIAPSIPGMNNPIVEYLMTFLGIVNPTASTLSIIDSIDDLFRYAAVPEVAKERLRQVARSCDRLGDYRVVFGKKLTHDDTVNGYGQFKNDIAYLTARVLDRDSHLYDATSQWCDRVGLRPRDLWSVRRPQGRYVCFARAGAIAPHQDRTNAAVR